MHAEEDWDAEITDSSTVSASKPVISYKPPEQKASGFGFGRGSMILGNERHDRNNNRFDSRENYSEPKEKYSDSRNNYSESKEKYADSRINIFQIR